MGRVHLSSILPYNDTHALGPSLTYSCKIHTNTCLTRNVRFDLSSLYLQDKSRVVLQYLKNTYDITWNYNIVGIYTKGSRPGPRPQDYEEDLGCEGARQLTAGIIDLLVIIPEAVLLLIRFSEDSKSECCGVAKDQYWYTLGKEKNGRPVQENDSDINRRYRTALLKQGTRSCVWVSSSTRHMTLAHSIQ